MDELELFFYFIVVSISALAAGFIIYKLNVVQKKLHDLDIKEDDDSADIKQRRDHFEECLSKIDKDLCNFRDNADDLIGQFKELQKQVAENDTKSNQTQDTLGKLSRGIKNMMEIVDKVDTLKMSLDRLAEEVASYRINLDSAQQFIDTVQTKFDDLYQLASHVFINVNQIFNDDNELTNNVQTLNTNYENTEQRYKNLSIRAKLLSSKQNTLDNVSQTLIDIQAKNTTVMDKANDAQEIISHYNNVESGMPDFENLMREARQTQTSLLEYNNDIQGLQTFSSAFGSAVTETDIRPLQNKANDLTNRLNTIRTNGISTRLGQISSIHLANTTAVDLINPTLERHQSTLDTNNTNLGNITGLIQTDSASSRLSAVQTQVDGFNQTLNNQRRTATTSQLCVDGTCIRKEQLQKILNC